VTIILKGLVNSKQDTLHRHKCFGTNIYKLCANSGYGNSMDVHLKKNRPDGTADAPVTVKTLHKKDGGTHLMA
jgi:hypothetical protein